ncbi:PREDICTED: methylcrotonoyl-CoA carboxylase beta chain, mitochondrial-like isoform X2 [Priapulus caudatus]|nr:PREDICTED: methylcrotonoyl-CoA carboxylase beta chain, mitochondrial-like isoform X2 [Priapulus caudatus]
MRCMAAVLRLGRTKLPGGQLCADISVSLSRSAATSSTLLQEVSAKPTHTTASRSKFRVVDGRVDDVSKPYWETLTKSRLLAKQWRQLVDMCRQGGGERSVKRHTEVNKKLLVRRRLQLLLDDQQSFLELGSIAGVDMDYGDVPSAGMVSGIGRVSNTWVMIVANDATVKGGTVYPITVKKQLRMQEIAKELRLPCIYLIDSGGAFLPLQADIFPETGGQTFYNQAVMNSMDIAQVTMVCGSCTAGAAYVPTMATDTIIVDRIGTIFLAGPPLVRAALGEVVTPEELGGATLHTGVSGCADYFARDEEEGFEMLRDSIACLNRESPAVDNRHWEEPLYASDELAALAPDSKNSPIHVDKVLARILDGSAFHSFKAKYSSELVTGFGHIQGHLVGIVANNGELTEKAAMKGSHFVQLCSQRDVPLLFLQNSSSMSAQHHAKQHQGAILRAHASMMAAVATSNVRKITVTTGSNRGMQSFAVCGRSFSPSFMFVWPQSKVSMMDDSSLQGKLLQDQPELLEEMDAQSSAFYAASRMWNDGVILPQDTRKVVAHCLDIFASQKRLHSEDNMNYPVYRL